MSGEKIRQIIIGEFTNWQLWEIIYIFLSTAAIAVISIYLGDDALGIASAVAGTLYTMLAGKGKISCYIFGIFNSAAYGYIAYSQRLFGDAMLNWLWYLPVMFAGIVMWRKKMDKNSCVIKNSLSCRWRVITFAVCAAAIAVYAYILHRMGDSQPVVDSITTVLSIAAMILTLRRCIEQWIMWIAVNAVSVGMWARVYLQQGNSVATLLWWLIMLITGIMFFIRWHWEMREKRA